MKKNISVVLPVRNGEKYIFDAVNSVLNQTYTNFECIIVNDGSTDETLSIINSFNDHRIKVITTEGVGLVNALNIGIERSSNEIIARMDADDICMLNRFEEQIQYFNDSKVGVVCSNIEIINERNEVTGCAIETYNDRHEVLDMLLYKKKKKPIVHPSSMVRKSLLLEIGGYRHFNSSEDRDLWLRLVDKCDFVRTQKKLLKYRINPEGISKSKSFEQKLNSMMTVINYEIFKDKNIEIYNDEVLFNIAKKYLEANLDSIQSNFIYFETFKEKTAKKTKLQILKIFFSEKNKFDLFKYYLFSTYANRRVIKQTISEIVQHITKDI